MNKDECDKVQTLLPDICPIADFSLKVEDGNLAKPGFADSAPCVGEFGLTINEFYELLDELNNIEIDAFNTPNGTYPLKSDPAYQKYLKYGCLYDILYNAEIITAE